MEPESREFLTTNTHRGLYQFTRLPFGVKTAPAIFQSIMDNLISGLEGIVTYLDDILVVGRSEEELQGRIERLLKRITEYGFYLRPDKCEFFLYLSLTRKVDTRIQKIIEQLWRCHPQPILQLYAHFWD